MTTRKLVSVVVSAMGVTTLVVGVFHFVMMDHLMQWVAARVDPVTGSGVVAAFSVNHIGTGVFLILLGIILTYAGRYGLRLGKRWARNITLVFGLGLSALTITLWLSVPPMFLGAAPFRWALVLLGVAGGLTAMTIILCRNEFNEA